MGNRFRGVAGLIIRFRDFGELGHSLWVKEGVTRKTLKPTKDTEGEFISGIIQIDNSVNIETPACFYAA